MSKIIGMFLAFPTLAIGLLLIAENSWATPPPDAQVAGWFMTGGGSVFTDENDFFVPAGTRVTHGFQLHCDADLKPNNLQVNTHLPDGGGSRFHLDELILARCWNDPEANSGRPAAPFDHYWGFGIGSLDGEAGFCADWIFTDEGEPGTEDRIELLRIWDCATEVFFFSILLEAGHPLTFGNHQAHGEKGANN